MSAMEGQFDLHIDLSNATMRTPLHVADALAKAGSLVERGFRAGTVYDEAGKAVGKWRYVDPIPPEFTQALAEFKQAAARLCDAWSGLDVDPAVFGDTYPGHWRSFDEERLNIDSMEVQR